MRTKVLVFGLWALSFVTPSILRFSQEGLAERQPIVLLIIVVLYLPFNESPPPVQAQSLIAFFEN